MVGFFYDTNFATGSCYFHDMKALYEVVYFLFKGADISHGKLALMGLI